jgi:hypothetical protein
MAYPSLEQYNQAFQLHSRLLEDSELRSCKVATSGLGLPLAISGGFALTYTLTNSQKKYAVRCFHRESKALEKRYEAISKKISNLKSKYFLDFQFQPKGIRVDGSSYPVVKMAWAQGETLGEFLDANHSNSQALSKLESALAELARFLESESISHGDVQTGNLMVSGGGSSLQLIDYDGMYVDEIAGLGSSELGHVNFQHAQRKLSNPFRPGLDRFSFICLSIAIKALKIDKTLWAKTNSELDAIVFRSNDFIDPGSSRAFALLASNSALAEDAKNFASICQSPIERVPSLADFLARRNIPSIQIHLSGVQHPGQSKAGYVGAYEVLSAKDFNACLQHVGDKVEVIGRVTAVKHSMGKNSRPYVFINFSDWRGNVFKINIWHDGLSAIRAVPDATWVGKWLSVVGLMEPRFTSGNFQSSNVSITVSTIGQMSAISEDDAKWRLGILESTAPTSASTSLSSDNLSALSRIKGGTVANAGTRATAAPGRQWTIVPNPTSSQSTTPSHVTPVPGGSGVSPQASITSASGANSSNKALLDKIRSTSIASQGARPIPGGTRKPSRPYTSSQGYPRHSQRPPEKGLIAKLFDWLF